MEKRRKKIAAQLPISIVFVTDKVQGSALAIQKSSSTGDHKPGSIL